VSHTRSFWDPSPGSAGRHPRHRSQVLGGASADRGAQGVEFCESTGGSPDLVALALGQHLEHRGRGEPAERAVRARIGGAGDPLGRSALKIGVSRRASMIFSSAELLRGRATTRQLRPLYPVVRVRRC